MCECTCISHNEMTKLHLCAMKVSRDQLHDVNTTTTVLMAAESVTPLHKQYLITYPNMSGVKISVGY